MLLDVLISFVVCDILVCANCEICGRILIGFFWSLSKCDFVVYFCLFLIEILGLFLSHSNSNFSKLFLSLSRVNCKTFFVSFY